MKDDTSKHINLRDIDTNEFADQMRYEVHNKITIE